MHRLEYFLIVLCLLSIALIFFETIGGSLFFTVFCIALSSYYVLAGFGILNHIKFKELFKKSTYKNRGTLNILWGIGSGLWVYSIAIIAILFHLLSRPGADAYCQIAIGSLLLEIVLAIIVRFKKGNFSTLHLTRGLIYLSVVSTIYVLNIEMDFSYIEKSRLEMEALKRGI